MNLIPFFIVNLLSISLFSCKFIHLSYADNIDPNDIDFFNGLDQNQFNSHLDYNSITPMNSCDACQYTAISIFNFMAEKSYTSNKKGDIDFHALNSLSGNICDRYSWMQNFDNNNVTIAQNFEVSCGNIIDSYREDWIDIIPYFFKKKIFNQEIKKNLINKLCLDTKLCDKLWTEEQNPQNNQKIEDINLIKAENFIKKLKEQNDIHSTESGLLYKILHKSNNTIDPDIALTDDTNLLYTVKYQGRNLDDKIFDSNDSFTLNPNSVILGWKEGLKLMNIGDEFEFYIHPKLAYGVRGAGNVIQPNELLKFKIKVLNITAKNKNSQTSEDL